LTERPVMIDIAYNSVSQWHDSASCHKLTARIQAMLANNRERKSHCLIEAAP